MHRSILNKSLIRKAARSTVEEKPNSFKRIKVKRMQNAKNIQYLGTTWRFYKDNGSKKFVLSNEASRIMLFVQRSYAGAVVRKHYFGEEQ
ncbi:MAG TPA: hypothetical protein DEF05_06560 [Erwinia sp.]|uniref:hypothetical protein n=1 Tax=Erwinia citreus TaxID=558 RepID=UPI000E7EF73A|nr:hypothetical protein [Erwinia sp.]HBV39339.1 hypothetical protein [Erwinia sp.]